MKPLSKLKEPEQRVTGLARLRELRAITRPERQPVRAELPTVAGDSVTATIRIYDPIDSWGDFWGISAKEFATVLDGLPDTVTEIRLLLNSPGGEVFDGIAIMNQLRRHDAKVVAVVEGLAASAASFIACSADELVMAPNSELMIHDAWGCACGNAQELRDYADNLDRFSDNIASIYVAKAGGDLAAWRAVMAREQWYSAEEAVTAGLADSVDEKVDDAIEAKARVDLSIFNHAGRAKAPAPSSSSAPPPSNRPNPGPKGGSSMDLNDVREALGLPDDTTDDDVYDAVVDKLTAPPPPAPTPEPAAAIPEGHVVVPEARLTDLETAAASGVAAAETLRLQERNTFLDSVRAKYAPTNRAAWEAEYDRDADGTRAHFASAPDILPLNAIGAGGAADLDSDAALYDSIYGKEAKV